MSRARIQLVCHADPVRILLDALLAELADRPREVVQAVLRRFESIDKPLCVERETLAAVHADQVLFVLQPSEALLALLAAVRAGDFDV